MYYKGKSISRPKLLIALFTLDLEFQISRASHKQLLQFIFRSLTTECVRNYHLLHASNDINFSFVIFYYIFIFSVKSST